MDPTIPAAAAMPAGQPAPADTMTQDTPTTELPPMQTFSEWASEQPKAEDPLDSYRGYRDFSKTELLKRGSYSDELAGEIDQALVDHAQTEGLDLGEDASKTFYRRPDDADADALHRHALETNNAPLADAAARFKAVSSPTLKASYDDPAEYEKVRESALADYTALADTDTRNAARKAALNRGDTPFAVMTNKDGSERLEISPELRDGADDKTLAALFEAHPEIDRRLIGAVKDSLKPIDGFDKPRFMLERAQDFGTALDALSRQDPSIAKDISQMVENASANWLGGDQRRITGDGIDRIDRALAGTPLGQDFSEEERKGYIRDAIIRAASPATDEKSLDNNFTRLSTGEYSAPTGLVLNKALFTKAVTNSKVIPEAQKKLLLDTREARVSASAVETFKLITRARPEFTAVYDKAKAAGETNADILDKWMSDPANHSTTMDYLKGVGTSVAEGLGGLVLYPLALAGSDAAKDTLTNLQKSEADRVAYAQLFGKNLGAGYDLARLVAPVAADIGVTVITGGLAGEVVAAKWGFKLALKETMRTALGAEARSALKSFTLKAAARDALRTGAAKGVKETGEAIGATAAAVAEAPIDTVLHLAGRDIAHQLTHSAQVASYMTTAFTRSAGSTYVQLSATLSEQKNADGSLKYTPEQVREISLNHGLIAGTITAAVTGGFTFLGRAGMQSIFEGGLTRKQLGSVLTRLKSDGPLRSMLTRKGIDLATVDTFLDSSVRNAIKPLWKQLSKDAADEGMEEGLDQFLGYFNQQIATGDKIDLMDAARQAGYAAFLGAAMGGTIPGVKAAFAPGEAGGQQQAAAATATLLDAATRMDHSAKLLQQAGKLDAAQLPRTAAILREAALRGVEPEPTAAPTPDAAAPDAAASAPTGQPAPLAAEAVPEGTAEAGVEQAPSGAGVAADAGEAAPEVAPLAPAPEATTQDSGGTVTLPTLKGSITGEPLATADPEAVQQMRDAEAAAAAAAAPEPAPEPTPEGGGRLPSDGKIREVAGNAVDSIKARAKDNRLPAVLNPDGAPTGWHELRNEGGVTLYSSDGTKTLNFDAKNRYNQKEVASQITRATEWATANALTSPSRDSSKPEQMTPDEATERVWPPNKNTASAPTEGKANLNGMPASKVKGHWSYEGNLQGKQMRLGVTDPQTAARLDHQLVLATEAVAHKPLSAESVEYYDIKLPDGYVKKGELYVWAPTSEPAVSPASETAQSSETPAPAEPTLPDAQIARALEPDPAADVADNIRKSKAPEAAIIEDPAAMPAVEDVLGRVGIISEGPMGELSKGDAAFLLNVVGEVPKVKVTPEPGAKMFEPNEHYNRTILKIEFSELNEDRIKAARAGTDADMDVLNAEYQKWVEGREKEIERTRSERHARNQAAFLADPVRGLAELDELRGRSFDFGEQAIISGIVTTSIKRNPGKGSLVHKGTISEGTVSSYKVTAKCGERVLVHDIGSRNDARDKARTEAFVAGMLVKAIAQESTPAPAPEPEPAAPAPGTPSPGTRVSFSHPSVGGEATGVVLDEPAPAGKIKVQVDGKKVKLNVPANSPVVGEPPTPDKPKGKSPKPKRLPSRNPAIDKSTVTAELNAHNFQQGTQAFLQSVAATGPKHLRPVAKLLLEFPELLAATPVTLVHAPGANLEGELRGWNLTVQDFKDVRKGGNFAGMLVPSTGQILVNTAVMGPRGSVDMLLHELLHAATVRSIISPTPAQAKIIARLERVRQSVRKRVLADPVRYKGMEYGIGDLSEFVTHFFTSPAFQQQVAAMTPKGQKKWVRVILDTIRELLGAKRKSASDIALEGVMNDMILFTRDAAAGTFGTPRAEQLLMLPGTPAPDGGASIRDTVRFYELTEGIEETPEGLLRWEHNFENRDALAELKRMRADTLNRQGYTIGPVWHGTNAEFNKFEAGHESEYSASTGGNFFTTNREWASTYGIAREFYIKNAKTWGGDDYVTYESSDSKSASPLALDPATGKLIPPNQWGDAASNDIRFLPSNEQTEEQLNNEIGRYLTGEYPIGSGSGEVVERETKLAEFVDSWLGRREAAGGLDGTPESRMGDNGAVRQRSVGVVRGKQDISGNDADGSLEVYTQHGTPSMVLPLLNGGRDSAAIAERYGIDPQVLESGIRAEARRGTDELEAYRNVTRILREAYVGDVGGLLRSRGPVQSDFATEQAVRDTAAGYMPVDGSANDLQLDCPLLTRYVEGHHPANAEDIVRSFVNKALSHRAGLDALSAEGEAATPEEAQRLSDLLDRVTRGNTSQSDIDFYRADPSALARLTRYLAAAVKAAWARLKLRWDIRSAVMIDRMNRMLGDSAVNFEERTMQFDPSNPQATAGMLALPGAQSDAQNSPAIEELREELAFHEKQITEFTTLRQEQEAAGNFAEASNTGFMIRMAESAKQSAQYAIDMKPVVDLREELLTTHAAAPNMAKEAEARGNHLVFRMVRNMEEAAQILEGIKSGNPASGFRNATSIDGHALSKKAPAILRAEKKGAIPVFTSPYPTVSKLYEQGAALMVAIEYSPDGEVYVSSRAGQTQGAAYSATFADSEHVIDARSIKDVKLLTPAQVALIAQYNTFFDGQVRRGAYANAFKDKDGELTAANLEGSRNLLPIQTTLGRSFTEVPAPLPNGLGVMKGQKVRLKNGAVAVASDYRLPPAGSKWPARMSVTSYKGELPELSAEVIAHITKQSNEIPKDRLDVYYEGSVDNAIRKGIEVQQSNYKSNVPLTDVVAVWDKTTKRWMEADPRFNPASSDIRFLPGTTPAGTVPTPAPATPAATAPRYMGFMNVWHEWTGKDAALDKDFKPVKGFWRRLGHAVSRTDDLTPAASNIAKTTQEIRRATQNWVTTHKELGEKLLKNADPALIAIVQQAVGSNKPMLTDAEGKRIARETAQKIADARATVQPLLDDADRIYTNAVNRAKTARSQALSAIDNDLPEPDKRKLQNAALAAYSDTKGALSLVRDASKTAAHNEINERVRKAHEEEVDAINQSKFDFAQEARRQQGLAMQELDANHPAIARWVRESRAAIDELQQMLSEHSGTPENLQFIIDLSKGVYLVRQYKAHQIEGYMEAVRLNDEYAGVRGALADAFERGLMEHEMDALRGTGDFDALSRSEQEIEAMKAREERAYNRIHNKPDHANKPEDDVREIARQNVAAQKQILMEEFLIGHETAKKAGVGMSEVRVEFERYLNKTDMPQEFLDALGEITDPILNLARTHMAVAGLLTTQRALAEYKKVGLEAGWLITKEQKDGSDKYRNGVPLLSSNPDSPAYAPLAGLYADPVQKEAFDARFGSHKPKAGSTAENILESAQRGLYGMSGASLGVVTMGNPAKYMRDMFGAHIMALAQGAWKPSAFNYRATFEAAFGFTPKYAITGGALTPDAQEQQTATVNKLIALGVLNNGVHIGTIKDIMAEMQTNPSGALDAIQGLIAKGSVKAAKIVGKAREGGTATLDFLGKASQFTESLANLNVFFNELDALTRAKFAPTEDALWQEAARRTKMVMPMKDESSQMTNAFTRSTFGLVLAPFIRFKSEMIRTTMNTYRLAWEDVHSGNAVLKAHGMQRFAAAGLVHGAFTMGLPFLAAFMAGIGDDEDRAIRAAMPVYARNSSFIYLKRANGITTLDLTYLNPLSFVVDPFTQSIKASLNNRWEDLPKVAGRFAATEFFGENIAASSVLDVNRNMDANTDRPIYLETDTLPDKMYKSVAHVVESAYAPAILKKPWQAVAALDRPTKEDEQFFYTPAGIIASLVAPIKPRDYKVEDLAYRAMRNLNKANGQLWQYTAPLMSPAPLSTGEVEGIYQDRIAASTRINRQLWEIAQGYKGLGMSTQQIVKIAENAGFSREKSVKVIMRGVMDRPVLPEESITKMNKIDPARAIKYREVIAKYPRLVRVGD